MYADQITAARKRSVKERLNGDFGDDLGRSTAITGKRQRLGDDKWKHDLYDSSRDARISKPIDPKDLRLKLQKKSAQQTGVRDLREQLSGMMHSQPPNTVPAKVKRVSKISETIKKNLQHNPPSEVKRIFKPSSSKRTSQQKSESSVDSFLRSLGLEKHLISFEVEEVDMEALKHMSDEDLKALGIPMGPRKKILLALESQNLGYLEKK